MGDKNSDNIPAIAPRIGIKTAEELIASGDIDNLLAGNSVSDKVKGDHKLMVENYNRNKKLIDLTKTPAALIDLLEKELEVVKPATAKGVYQYIVKHKMRDLFYKISQIEKVMRKLDIESNVSLSTIG
jgi:hypothetical protein